MMDDRTTSTGNEDDPSRPFMSLTTSETGRYARISCLICFLGIYVVFLGVPAFCGASRQELAGIAFFLGIAMAINLLVLSKGNGLPSRYRIPSSRRRPLLTVNGKFVEFDIPQLFLAQINSKSTLKAIFGFKQRPLQSHFVTIVSACCWKMTADRQTLFVTTRLPVWGPFKVRLRTEWDVPEFAVDRWTEFVSKVNQSAKA